MSLLISSVYTYDADASAYILAVEAADEIASPGIGALEPATRSAINKFVVGCKADGIWPAIKASCILAGARTLTGALVPLVGAAPTNFNFVSGDYNRKTGLVGDGSTKYLNSNRASNLDPNDNNHMAVFTTFNGSPLRALIGSYNPASPIYFRYLYLRATGWNASASSNAQTIFDPYPTNTGLIGASKIAANSVTFRANLSSAQFTQNDSQRTDFDQPVFVFARNLDAAPDLRFAGRLAFYSIGESLDLARLDARVTDLINAFAVTIP